MSISDKRIRDGEKSEIKSGTFAVAPHHTVFAIESKDSKVIAIDLSAGAVKASTINITQPFGIASSNEYVAVAGQDAVVTVFRVPSDVPYAVMPSYRDRVTCTCVNATFQVALIGTRDGYVIVNSLNKRSTVRILDLDGAKPTHAIVTEAWGFILIYASTMKRGNTNHILFLFSVNGELLRKMEVKFELSCWKTWTSTDGFDYMLIADTEGRLFSFEVFYMNISKPVFRCQEPVIAVSFEESLRSVVIVTHTGKICLFSHDPELS